MAVQSVVVFAAGALFCLTPTLSGHGGNYGGRPYRGPADTVPGGGKGGGKSSGPAGPTTPGPSGPTTPSPSSPNTPGPTTPPSGPPTGGPRAGPTTGGPRGVQIGEDLTDWTYWWENNKAPYLQLKQAVHAAGVLTGSDDFLMGRGLRTDSSDTLAPSPKDLKGVVVPALRRALEDAGSNRDIVSSCMVALARIGIDTEVLPLFEKRLASRDQEIRETAALAMGIFGDVAAVPSLLALAADDRAGRQLVRKEEVDFRTRSFACYGLGLIAHQARDIPRKTRIFEAMKSLVASGQKTRRDVKVAGLQAIRLLNPPRDTPAGERLVGQAESFLLEFAKRKDEYPIVRSHAFTAVADLRGRNASREVLRTLTAVLKDRRARSWLQQSAALALGQMARPEDTQVSKDLVHYLQRGRDAQARYFSALALGQIGGEKNRNTLLKLLGSRRTQTLVKPWIALGLALHEQKARAADPTRDVDRTIAQEVLAEFQRVRSPGWASGFAIALGLMRYREAADPILERILTFKNQDDLVGYLSVALGLMGARSASEEINGIVDRSLRRPAVLSQCTIALGLLGDKTIALKLADRLKDHRNVVAVQAALAFALGFIGDRRTIAPLVASLADKKLKNLSRAFAAVALGLIGDKEMLPWNTKIAVNVNYRANVETLSNRLSGVLDIL